MNKQEAIGKIKSMGTVSIYSALADQRHDMIIKGQVLDIISQIDEPQKVVVPKFIGEWLDYCKHDKFYALHGAYANMDEEMKCWRFIGNNSDLFAKAWLEGYEIEKEKLYTVEIPNPNRPDIVTFLYKENGKVFIGNDIFLDEVPNYKWRNEPENQLTESEIKQDFEWAWQFKKEVK